VRPSDRTDAILTAALHLAARHGYHTLTRDAIALAAGVSPAHVSARRGPMDAMRRSVMRAAVARRCVGVVAQGLAVKCKHAAKADKELRALAAAYVAA
jgi:archaeosine-15-forming tRNA-guanine transglycosylase